MLKALLVLVVFVFNIVCATTAQAYDAQAKTIYRSEIAMAAVSLKEQGYGYGDERDGGKQRVCVQLVYGTWEDLGLTKGTIRTGNGTEDGVIASARDYVPALVEIAKQYGAFHAYGDDYTPKAGDAIVGNGGSGYLAHAGMSLGGNAWIAAMGRDGRDLSNQIDIGRDYNDVRKKTSLFCNEERGEVVGFVDVSVIAAKAGWTVIDDDYHFVKEEPVVLSDQDTNASFAISVEDRDSMIVFLLVTVFCAVLLRIPRSKVSTVTVAAAPSAELSLDSEPVEAVVSVDEAAAVVIAEVSDRHSDNAVTALFVPVVYVVRSIYVYVYNRFTGESGPPLPCTRLGLWRVINNSPKRFYISFL